MPGPQTIEYFFDPSCPWTWMTSRWLVDAAAQTDREITWRNLSLGVINAGRDIPDKYRAPMKAAHRAHRIIAAMRAGDRNDEIGDYYTEWGRRFHHDRAEPTDELAVAVAAACGAGEWAGAADDERWDADIEASTKEGQELAGGSDVGSPIVVVGSPRRGLFGPIVSPPPSGDEAAALLDHVLAIAALPAFYELKRGRQGGPQFGIRP